MSDDFSFFTSLRYDVALKEVPSKGIQFAGWNYHNESPLYMLDFHRDRILRAALHWKWGKVVEQLSGNDGLQQLAKAAENAIGASGTSPLRLQIVVTKEGEMTYNTSSVPALEIGNLFPEVLPAPGTKPGPNQPQVPPRVTVVLDSVESTRSEYTHFKTTNRTVYDDARARAGISSISPPDALEVLLVNDEDNSIMEGSTTTPYFWRDGSWITPPVSSKFSRQDGSGGNDGTSRRWALERALAVEREIRADQLVDGEECYISNGVRGFRAGIVNLKKAAT
ncbi:Aminodeoxychorismate lyase [Conoideocrella luteorostrata]|uniref:Aminodeoxychorismate lyase n=1 Tax=Conoideocrella luteorostrata TaxID=1105319 RepID=A0AAJ0CVQ8_9HYPO|nr:Aminodeoxychorismate lyase [Conoideocrella luteorostrata]